MSKISKRLSAVVAGAATIALVGGAPQMALADELPDLTSNDLTAICPTGTDIVVQSPKGYVIQAAGKDMGRNLVYPAYSAEQLTDTIGWKATEGLDKRGYFEYSVANPCLGEDPENGSGTDPNPDPKPDPEPEPEPGPEPEEGGDVDSDEDTVPLTPLTPAKETQPVDEDADPNPYGDEAEEITVTETEEVDVDTFVPADKDDKNIIDAMVKVTGKTEDGRFIVEFNSINAADTVYTVIDRTSGEKAMADLTVAAGADSVERYLPAGQYKLTINRIGGKVITTELNLGQTVNKPIKVEKPLPTWTEVNNEDLTQLRAMVLVSDPVTNDKGDVRYPIVFKALKNLDVTYLLVNRETGENAMAPVVLAAGGEDATRYFDAGVYELTVIKSDGTAKVELYGTINLGQSTFEDLTSSKKVMPADAIVLDPRWGITGQCVNGEEKLSFKLRHDDSPNAPIIRYGVGELNVAGQLVNAPEITAPITIDRPADGSWIGVVIDVDRAVEANQEYGNKLYFPNGTRAAMFPVEVLDLACAQPADPDPVEPSEDPTEEPSEQPTDKPAVDPTEEPTDTPTDTEKKPADAKPGDKKLASTGAESGVVAALAALFAVAGASALRARRRA